ncbi:hypothetical protein AXF42_Ash018578 [Apostasia shenzhenica]|uniref:GTD-binding domain-containing protein n=1 Tax=Apostasia shenzhenica TaxID=1088818 RepID=A0A2I0APW7_9ASPA|nr:hypothetical protein AXF42_Ash018578 [Apostasia shenzhenica]
MQLNYLTSTLFPHSRKQVKLFPEMEKREIAALKEALGNQYIIMKKLYSELEEEREASATAASEALSMILRLQREKAAEKMEACQYKRMAEERIHHAEESLEMFEELIQQKDMEIESLHYQLEDYTQNFSSLGISTTDFIESESKSFGEMSAKSHKGSFKGNLRRIVSLPSLRCTQFCSEIDDIDDKSLVSSSGGSVWRMISDLTHKCIETSEKDAPDLIQEAIAKDEKLDWRRHAEEVNKKVKNLIPTENSEEVGSSSTVCSNQLLTTSSISSWFSAKSSGGSSDSSREGKDMKLEDEATFDSAAQSDDTENVSSMEGESNGNEVQSAFVLDIFEVPDSHIGCKPGENCRKVLQESITETKNMIEMPELRPKESSDYLYKHHDCLSKELMGKHLGSEFSIPGKVADIHHGSKMTVPKMGNLVNYHHALMDPMVGCATTPSDLEQLRRRLQQLEDERIIMQQDSERGKEQLKLLRQMFKQLNTIETHIRRSTSRKNSPMEESSLVSVMELLSSQTPDGIRSYSMYVDLLQQYDLAF